MGKMWIFSLKKYFTIFAYLSVVTRLQITRSYIEHMSLLNYFFEQAIFWIMIWVKYFESNKLGVELSDNDDYSYKFDFSPINSSRTRLLHEEIFNKKKFLKKNFSQRFLHTIFSLLII